MIRDSYSKSHKTEVKEIETNFQTELIQSGIDDKTIVLTDRQGIQFVNSKDILRCEADRAYCTFYLTNGKKFRISKSLKFFEDKLLEWNFIRVHKSNIVNLRHIQKYLSGQHGKLILSDKSIVTISQRKRPEFLDKMKSYAV